MRGLDWALTVADIAGALLRLMPIDFRAGLRRRSTPYHAAGRGSLSLDGCAHQPAAENLAIDPSSHLARPFGHCRYAAAEQDVTTTVERLVSVDFRSASCPFLRQGSEWCQ